jgi:hypothetical protein
MKLDSLLTPANRASLKKKLAKRVWPTPKTMLTVTGFEAMHQVSSGNGHASGSLVELVTTHREVEIVATRKKKDVYYIYLKNVRIHNRIGGKHDVQTGKWSWPGSYSLTIRKGSKVEVIEPRGDGDNEDKLDYRLADILGDVGKQRFAGYIKYDIERIERGERDTELCKSLAVAGWEVVGAFLYDERVYICPEYVKTSGYKIEFGYTTKETYHSLPRVMVIDFLPSVRMQRLDELGIETEGYYDHHVRHTIKAEHVPAAQRFARKFKQRLKQSKTAS